MVILFFIFCSIGKCFGCVLVNCTTIIVFCLQYSCSICLLRFKKENTRSWNLFKANKKKTPEWRHWRRSASLLLTLNWFYSFFWYSIIEFEQVNASWVGSPFGEITGVSQLYRQYNNASLFQTLKRYFSMGNNSTTLTLAAIQILYNYTIYSGQLFLSQLLNKQGNQ